MTIRHFKKTFFIMILAAIQTTVAITNDHATSIKQNMDRLLKGKEFSGAVLVVENGNPLYQSALGFADLDHKIPLTSRSSFNLASVAKQFTAAAIMILFENKQLQLDDPAAKHLSELAYLPEITIRHLLHHTAGLPDIYNILESTWDKSKVAGNEVMLEIFARTKPKPLFRPGEKMQYSNTAYIVLASIVEKVAGLPFYKFLEDRIFVPLGMNDSFAYYLTMKEYPRPTRVFGMKRENGQLLLNDLIFCDGMRGDGNVYSSLEDLLQWDRALYGEKLLKPESIRLMFTPGYLNDGTAIDYGFGFGISDKGRVVSHGGAWVGFRSLIIRYLDRRGTIIMLINCPSPKNTGIVDEIKKTLLK